MKFIYLSAILFVGLFTFSCRENPNNENNTPQTGKSQCALLDTSKETTNTKVLETLSRDKVFHKKQKHLKRKITTSKETNDTIRVKQKEKELPFKCYFNSYLKANRKDFALKVMAHKYTEPFQKIRKRTFNNLSVDAGYLPEGYIIQAGYEHFLSKYSSLTTNFSFITRKGTKLKSYDYKPSFDDFIITEMYRFYYPIGNWNPYIGAGIFGGYEDFYNKDKKPESVIIQRSNSLIYGLNIALGLEYNIKNYSLFAEISPKYEIYHQELISNLVNLGLKYYF